MPCGTCGQFCAASRIRMPDVVHLLVIAKAPVPGRVKTRLSPAFTPEQAAALAEAALRDTLDAVLLTRAAERTVFLDGSPGPWLPSGLRVVPQRGEGLDERLAAAFDDAWTHRPLPMLLVGMDTPQLTSALLDACVGELLTPEVDAVLGPATDGGFWAIGLRRPNPDLSLGVPMSLPTTGRAQLQRLQDGGLRVAMLPELMDVDTPDDAAAVAAGAPGTQFATTLTAMVRGTVGSDVRIP